MIATNASESLLNHDLVSNPPAFGGAFFVEGALCSALRSIATLIQHGLRSAPVPCAITAVGRASHAGG